LLAVLYGKAIGIDINPKLVAYSRQFNWDKICVMDMHSMAFKAETFDMVFANNVLEHSYNPDKVLREIMRILKPGGYLAAMIPMDGENVRVLIGVDRGNVAHAWKTTFRDCEQRFRSAGYTNLTIYRHSYQQVTGRKRLLGDKFGVFIAQKGIQANVAITSPVYERMVVMADLSEPALQLAKTNANARSASISLIKCDAFQLPFRDESFDVIFHQGFLEHFKHPEILIQKQKRILKRGGFLIVGVPRRYYTVGQLEQLLLAHDFEIVGTTGWGYYPWIFHIVRYLSKVRRYKPGKIIFPSFVSRFYDKLWEKFEKSRVALYTFVDLVVVGRK
jgi:ubiquinone/menaquinone biosynthesis C-methylase UbiE